MTIEQKEQVKILRENGLGFTKISNMMNLSRDTVKSYCHRNHIQPPVDEQQKTEIDFCACCFKVITHTPKHKKKRFCSTECRLKWWSEHRELTKHRELVACKCKQCGKEFMKIPNSTQKYCNRECYFAYRYGGEVERLG